MASKPQPSLNDLIRAIQYGSNSQAAALPKGFVPKNIAPGSYTPVKAQSVGGSSILGGAGHLATGGFHTVLDVLSRALSTGAAGVDDANATFDRDRNDLHKGYLESYGHGVQEGLKGMWAGLSGNEHKDYITVIQNQANRNRAVKEGKKTDDPTVKADVNPWVKYGVGLTGDILLDPLSYAGGIAAVSRGTKSLKELSAAEKAATGTQNAAKVIGNVSGISDLGRAGRAVGNKIVKIKNGKVVEEAAPVAERLAAAEAKIPQAAPIVNTAIRDAHNALEKVVNATNYRPHAVADINKAVAKVAAQTKSVADVRKAEIAHMEDYLTELRLHFNNGGTSAAFRKNMVETEAELERLKAADKPKAAPSAKAIQEFKPKTFEEIKGSISEADKEKIFKRARQLSKPKYKGHPLSKIEGTTEILKDGTKKEIIGFKGLDYQDIIDDPLLREGKKGLFSQPSFRDLHKASIEDAKKEFLAKYNEKLAIAHAKKMGAIEAAPDPTPVVEEIAKAQELAPEIVDAAPAHPEVVAEDRVKSTQPKDELEQKISQEIARKYDAAIKSNPAYAGHLTAAAQVNMRNDIAAMLIGKKSVNAAGKKVVVNKEGKRIHEAITRIYNHAEALLEHQGGFKPIINPEHLNTAGKVVAADTTPLRLSAILSHFTPNEIVKGDHLTQVMMGTGGNEAQRAIRDAAVASAHIEDAQKLQPIIKQISDAYRVAVDSGDIQDILKFARESGPAAKDAAKVADVSPAGVDSAAQAVTDRIDEIKQADPLLAVDIENAATVEKATKEQVWEPKVVQLKMDATSRRAGIRIGGRPFTVASGKAHAKFLSSLGLARDGKGLLSAVDDANLGKLANNVAKVDRWMQVGLNNALGFHDLAGIRNTQRNAGIGYTADAQAALGKLFRGYTKADSSVAFRAAQTGDIAGLTPELQGLAQTIAKRMDRIYGQGGNLRRSEIMPDDFARVLNKSFYDANGAVKVPFLAEHKDSIGGLTNVLDHPYDSWKAWNIPEGKYSHPARYMLAHEDAMNKAITMDQAENSAIAMFGHTMPFEGSVQVGKGHFTPDMAVQMDNMMKSWFGKGKGGGAFWHGYDRFLNAIKTGYTKYMPSHHINNSIGQFLLAFTDGLTDPRWYSRSIKVLKGHESEIDPLNEMPLQGAGDVVMHWKGRPLTTSQVYELGAKHGIRQVHATADDLGQDVKIMNRVSQKVQNMSNARENFHRYAHFMYALSESKAKTIEDAAMEASVRVNTIHGDYNDLTRFERTVAKRLIPFYTWQRKVGPIVFKQMMTNPGRTMIYPKIMSVTGQAISGQDTGEPFPQTDKLVPSYMQSELQTFLGNWGSASGNEDVIGGPRTPFADVVGKNLNDPVGNQLSSISPVLKLAAEFATRNDKGGGNSLGTGVPYQNFASHAEDSVPYVSVLKRLTRRDPIHGFSPTKTAVDKQGNPSNPDQQGFNLTALLNLLTAANAQPITMSAQRNAQKEVDAANASR